MSDDKIGWEINDRFYPHVGADQLLQGDYALIWELTGVNLDDFAEEGNFKLVELGWIGAAFWHGNPEMRRSQVVKILERLPDAAIVRVGFDAADDNPPAEEEESTTTSSSSTTTGGPQAERSSVTESPTSDTGSKGDSTQERSTLNGSGGQLSDTGVTSPLETWARSTNAGG